MKSAAERVAMRSSVFPTFRDDLTIIACENQEKEGSVPQRGDRDPFGPRSLKEQASGAKILEIRSFSEGYL